MEIVVSLALARTSWKLLGLRPQSQADTRHAIAAFALFAYKLCKHLNVLANTSLAVLQTLQVAAGGMHSVALAANHEIYSTGVNDEGALGRYTGLQALSSDAAAQAAYHLLQV